MNAPQLEPAPEEPTLALVKTVVAMDGRRPWPLGVPPSGKVLEAIGAHAEVEEALQAAHLRVLSLLPEHLYDAARTSLAGTDDPVALATASAWRTLVAADFADAAIGVDQPGLQMLIDEAVDAREKLLAAGYFALDGGASAEELMSALGNAIDHLVEKAQFRAKGKPGSARPATRVIEPEQVARPGHGLALRWACAVTVIATLAFHLFTFFSADRGSWVVVGDVDRGHAFIAPAGPEADESSLQLLVSQLEAKGLQVTKTASGEWELHRKQGTR